MLDLPDYFCECIIDYASEKYLERFSLQDCQLVGRGERSGMPSYDLVQKCRCAGTSWIRKALPGCLAQTKGGPHRNGGLNIVRADGEYWELWHGDGFSRETAAAVKKTWQEARQPGYDAYRKKLISEDKYRQR